MALCKPAATLLALLLAALCGEALGVSTARGNNIAATLSSTALSGLASRKLLQFGSAASAAAGPGAAAASAVGNLGFSQQTFNNWYNYYIQHGFGVAAAAAAGGVAGWAQHNGIPINSSPFFTLTNAAAQGWQFGGASGAATGVASAAASEGFDGSHQGSAASAATTGGGAAAAAAGGGGAAAAAGR